MIAKEGKKVESLFYQGKRIVKAYKQGGLVYLYIPAGATGFHPDGSITNARIPSQSAGHVTIHSLDVSYFGGSGSAPEATLTAKMQEGVHTGFLKFTKLDRSVSIKGAYGRNIDGEGFIFEQSSSLTPEQNAYIDEIGGSIYSTGIYLFAEHVSS